jgi:hypothetical protein
MFAFPFSNKIAPVAVTVRIAMSALVRFVVCSILACCSAAASAGNIVQDPGFEQGAKYWKAMHFALGPNAMWAHTDPGAARLTYCNYAGCLDRLNEGAYVSQLLGPQLYG